MHLRGHELVKSVLLISGGGIAAYKCLDLVRRLRERDIAVRAVLTKAAQEFVTPLSVAALTNERVFTDLFDLDDEREIGHIRRVASGDFIGHPSVPGVNWPAMTAGPPGDLATAV